jgi:hypothetical protein
MTWDMKAQTWVERQVTFFCADQPFAQGAMRKAFYIKFERNDRARGGDRMYVCILCISRQTCAFCALSTASHATPAGLWQSSP